MSNAAGDSPLSAQQDATPQLFAHTDTRSYRAREGGTDAIRCCVMMHASLPSRSHCFEAEASGLKMHMHSESQLVNQNYLIGIKK